ncbi:UbiX family flavin prenyltransferase [Arsenicitalea aurantiaca]|uniref:Flavin prenyltransferase UbiX n=1 Tax=Arsenicitalea aurantiaca TaxID=1783274 RepID=A0A433XKS0_9HYPH|nr:UbiX family flavin prenyltransferase [Arsenicitalea aurantiaca]RUT34677.1 UbiX family flavin prenyltransferase [Arsenicitalea aurantiaca]
MKRVIVGITGASGTILGVRALEILKGIEGVESHLVMSPSAVRTLGLETEYSYSDVTALADVTHNFRDIGSSVASGSFRNEGMIVAPCSVKTLSAVAHCNSGDLLSRAADVCLKERRRLVLMFRETPLHAGHIALMDQATRNGAIVMPTVIGLYYKPKTVDDIINHLVGRALDLMGIDSGSLVRRWGEDDTPDEYDEGESRDD